MPHTRHDTTVRGLDPQPEVEPLIDAKALAIWLGVSQHTVRKWITKGPEASLLPRMLRINGQIRFQPADVRDWLDKCALR